MRQTRRRNIARQGGKSFGADSLTVPQGLNAEPPPQAVARKGHRSCDRSS